jgi:hypothetical protein
MRKRKRAEAAGDAMKRRKPTTAVLVDKLVAAECLRLKRALQREARDHRATRAALEGLRSRCGQLPEQPPMGWSPDWDEAHYAREVKAFDALAAMSQEERERFAEIVQVLSLNDIDGGLMPERIRNWPRAGAAPGANDPASENR